MQTVYDIIQELNADNGANYKMDVLRRHQKNDQLQRVLKMTYDKVAFTYGVSMKNITMPAVHNDPMDLLHGLNVLEFDLATRKTTGHAALEAVHKVLANSSVDNQTIIKGILNRDLRINMGRSNINKVFPGLIVKPVYMRCGLYNKKTASKINPIGAYVQLKADGTYREFTVENGEVVCNSRSGEVYEYPVLNQVLCNYPDGHYIGELTVVQNGVTLDRATGNGMINSDDVPHNDLVLDLWDFVTLEEYTNAANKIKGSTPYSVRFSILIGIVGANTPNVRTIETYVVNSIAEALQYCNNWMTSGLEGAILKDADAIFRDGTSPQQLKLKLEIDIDVRWTGFIEGKIGTKREETFGSATFATDDGLIKGSCSGFNDAQLVDFNGRRNELIGKVFTVTCNDITQGRDNDYYALSHPRFVELRNDKDTTDTLERALDTKQMAMDIK